MAKTFILKILLKTFIENIYREKDGFKLHIYIYIYIYTYIYRVGLKLHMV